MTAKSKSALLSQAATDLPDNTAAEITPAILRGMIVDIIDSSHNEVDKPEPYVANSPGVHSTNSTTLVNILTGTVPATYVTGDSLVTVSYRWMHEDTASSHEADCLIAGTSITTPDVMHREEPSDLATTQRLGFSYTKRMTVAANDTIVVQHATTDATKQTNTYDPVVTIQRL